MHAARKREILNGWRLRTDGGPEFTAEFAALILERYVSHEKNTAFRTNALYHDGVLLQPNDGDEVEPVR